MRPNGKWSCVRRAALIAGVVGVAWILSVGAQTPIRVGQSIEGVLTEGDRKMPDGSYYDLYVFRGARGQHIVIRVRSEEFRPYVTLMDGNGVEILSGSDEGGRAEVRCTLGYSGRYFIRVNSVHPKGKGRYLLQLRRE